ncbi:MAG: PAS domain S-box protein [Nitrospirae bacterium]|uniref:PAS domain-containing sensor histidine kinase n=1 Tax=Candidatus Magnetobacterium casense TaxID=1455061 RepID=UPI00058FA06E|nr:PAS domain-containing sensor histidine kinase [Candidatus Magnetobacterium casensis]MBF0336660.1 PAS domain S-box protein [Nitrospirota bacterium]
MSNNDINDKDGNHFQRLVEAARDAILVMDQKGSVMYGNNAATRLFGYNSDELIGMSVEMLFPKGLDLLKRETKISESVAAKKDGSRFPAEVTVSSYEVDNRKFFMSMIRGNLYQHNDEGIYDGESYPYRQAKIEVETLLKQKELLIRQQDQIFEMYAYSAHTLKNYISTIITFFELLKRRKNKPDKLNELLEEDYIESLDFELKSMYELLVSVLKSTSVNNVEEGDLNVNEYIKKNLLPLRMGKKSSYLKVENRFPDDKQYYVRGIAVNLNTILRNVFNNARDEVIMHYGPWDDGFYAEGNMKILDTEESHIIIDGHVNDNNVLIKVSNKGRLIPDDKKEFIFEKGITFKTTGTGYGLTDCRKLTGEMGGTIWAENFGDKGATFCIQLPLVNVIEEGGATDD